MKLIARHGERETEVQVEETARGYRLTLDDTVLDVDVAHAEGDVRSLIIDGHQHEVWARSDGNGRYRVTTAEGTDIVHLTDPLSHLAEQASAAAGGGAQRITAYMPGVVKRILIAEGDVVTAGQGLAVLEAMKMENEIAAEADGMVTKILVEDGQAVDGGEALFEIGPPS